MRLSRLALALTLALPALAQAAFPNGIAAGDVSHTAAVLWARSDQPGTLTLELARDADFDHVLDSSIAQVADTTQPVKWSVDRLLPGRTYHYRAIDSAGSEARGRFQTPHLLGRQGLRFGVSGDWRGELAPYPAIRNAPARGLDFFVELGDTIYAENYDDPAIPTAATLAEYRAKYDQGFSEYNGLNAWRDLFAVTPVYATIDDHEVVNDFAGGAHPGSDARFDATGSFINETHRFADGLRAFQEYMPLDPQVYGATGDPRTSGKVKLYRSQRFGRDAAIFVLDARSFRDQELPAANPLDPASVGGWLVGTFNPARTMLGRRQVEDLKRDLLAAHWQGVTWKFVMLPEPVQNLGVVGGSDRYEGYAAERTELLKFINERRIRNVVFIAADIHGTVVNNLTYQDGPGQPQIPVQSWEISTGAVAYDAPFGPTVTALAYGLGLPGTLPPAVYATLPAVQKEAYITGLVNAQITPLGYDPLGLEGSGIPATLLQGGWTATNSYGWTEFDIDPRSQRLTVTTYGIEAYTMAQMQSDPDYYTGLTPSIVSQFRVEAR